jgi:hypothetical protein
MVSRGVRQASPRNRDPVAIEFSYELDLDSSARAAGYEARARPRKSCAQQERELAPPQGGCKGGRRARRRCVPSTGSRRRLERVCGLAAELVTSATMGL